MDQISDNTIAINGINPNIIVAVIGVLFVIGVLCGLGEHRKIIVFRTYDDLFLTFLIPALFGGGFLGIHADSEGDLFVLIGLLALAGSFIAFIYVTFLTLQSNSYSVWRFILAMIVKFPLAFIWVFQIIAIIKPGGDTAAQRAKNRTTALLILAFLTPMIGALVAEKTGVFSPRQVLKGKRIGSIRNHL